MNRQPDHDKTLDAWLRKQPLQPRQGFADETYHRAVTADTEANNRKTIAFPIQIAAAAAIVIAMLTTLSVWQSDTDSSETNQLYSSFEYIEMEELLLLENMLEPLALASHEVYPEYYW